MHFTVRRSATALATLLAIGAAQADRGPAVDLAQLAPLTVVNPRYQGFNVEMVEITGGRFWAPYGGPANEVYRQRPPTDLTQPRLIALARALGPSLMRVSGTWANNSYLEAPGERLSAPPPGYAQVLTRDQWKGVIAFAKAVDARLVTSFAVSTGARGPDGVWTPEQAQRRLDLTRELGGDIYAAEMFNEPDVPGAGSDIPKPYTAQNYAADFRVFQAWARKQAPNMLILGPGSVGEGIIAVPAGAMGVIASDDMMKANPNSVDGVSYHFYGGLSQRCAALKLGIAEKDQALLPAWLDLTLKAADFYGALRDKYEPGKPLWVTETGQAGCGGSPWASTFLDTFRYLNQLGALAQRGVQSVMHDTLASSDYALIDQDTLAPRPSYWGALLWRRTMGSQVLTAPASPSPDLRVYAHCMPDTAGGVGLMAINTGTTARQLHLSTKATTWTITGQPVDTRAVRINGRQPALDAQNRLTGLAGAASSGRVTVPAQAITFVAVPKAKHPACKANG